MKRRSRYFVLAGCLLLVIFSYVIHRYNRWWDRIQTLRWSAERQRELEVIWDRIHAYSKNHNGRFPSSPEAYISEGIISKSEMEFRDWLYGVLITRAIRPIPDNQFPHELILLVETYDPTRDFSMILRLDGNAVIVHDLTGALISDNLLRTKCSLPAVP